MAQIKGKFNYKHKREKWVQNMSKGKKGDFEIISLDLQTPPSIPSLVRQWKPSGHSLEMIRKSLFMPSLDLGRHEMSLSSRIMFLCNIFALLAGEVCKPS